MLFFMLSQSLAVDLLENFDERAFFYLVFESSIEEKAYAKWAKNKHILFNKLTVFIHIDS